MTNPNNYRAIRFADVLLMAAEAHNRKTNPDDAKALEYLNRVRTVPLEAQTIIHSPQEHTYAIDLE